MNVVLHTIRSGGGIHDFQLSIEGRYISSSDINHPWRLNINQMLLVAESSILPQGAT